MEHLTASSEWLLKSKHKWNVVPSVKRQVRRSRRNRLLLHVLQVISSLFLKKVRRFPQLSIVNICHKGAYTMTATNHDNDSHRNDVRCECKLRS